MLLRAASLLFHNFHNTLLNFMETQQKRHTMSNQTVLVYIPVCFQFDNEGHNKISSKTGNSNSSPQNVRESNLLKALHRSIETGLTELSDRALKGLEFEIFDFHCILLYKMLTLYVAGIPEAEDMLSAKCGTRSAFPCHNCLIRKNFSTNKKIKIGNSQLCELLHSTGHLDGKLRRKIFFIYLGPCTSCVEQSYYRQILNFCRYICQILI